MTKQVKEFLLDQATGEVNVEYDDNSTSSYNLSEVNTLVGKFESLADYTKGDGITDDSSGVQEWLDAIILKGIPGYIPKGIYKVTVPLTLESQQQVTIFGDGMDHSIIKGVGLAVDEDLLTVDALQNLTMSNFRLTFESGGRNLLFFQHTGPTTSVRHNFNRLHISNAINGVGFIANNLELSEFSHVYIYGCLDGFVANNTGNGSGFAASCVSNILKQVRVLNCRGKGMEFQNWAMTTLDHCQVLQCGKTIALDGSGVLTPGHVAQVVIGGSCNGFNVTHPDIEEYAVINGVQVFEKLTNGIQFSGTNHTLETPNFIGLNFPGKTLSANDFILVSPRVVQCLQNFSVDSASLRAVLIIPRQVSNSGPSTTVIGSGGSGYTGSPSGISIQGTGATFRLPKVTTTQRDAIVGVSSGDEIYNTTLNKKQVFNGSVWETVTSS